MDYSKAIWRPSPNFGYPNAGDHGRLGHLPVAIVDHIEQGSEASADSWFANPASQVSAHYSVARDGSVRQHVLEADAAWANGIDPARGLGRYKSDVSVPWIAALYADAVNANLVTISIEHEGLSGEALKEAQYQATLALHRDIFARNKWPVETGRIVGHSQVNFVDKPLCPGPAFPFARLYADLQAAVAPPPPPLDKAEIGVYSMWAQLRLANGSGEPADTEVRGPTGLAAFVDFLRGTGRDATDPTRWGWPA